ncbi:MAG: hypothetical protein HY890_05870 [Deltaproteobacteria bacterium]|nr:hypothetical protein [Deltaproteobacteria bacterium]
MPAKVNMVKRFFPVILFLLVVTQAHPGLCETLAVKAEGIGFRSDENPDVKAMALEDALRNAVPIAVRSAVKEALPAGITEQMEKAYPDALRYIVNYRILSEGFVRHYDMPPPGGEESPPASPGGVEAYHVWVEANVNTGQLRKDIQRLTPDAALASVVTVEVAGVEAYAAFDDLKQRIEGMDAVRELSYLSFSRERIVLAVAISGPAHAFFDRIAGSLGGGFAVIPAGADRVIIKKEEKGQ